MHYFKCKHEVRTRDSFVVTHFSLTPLAHVAVLRFPYTETTTEFSRALR